MDCTTAESLVNRYISHSLSVRELEEFLSHVENCPSCYDELETYFIVHEAVQQLNDQRREQVLDFRELLENDIRKSRLYILKMNFRRAVFVMGICILAAGIGGFVIYAIMRLL